MSALQEKFARKLDGARFRVINERLYTCKGEEAFDEFQADPKLFDVYHEGFREQVKSWPQNPVDIAVELINSRKGTDVIADMGCGDAMLARKVRNKVHSFDLVSRDSIVTACDMAHVPLPDGAVDVVTYSLALMGENVGDFLREAYRILKPGGLLWIAEVKSRFEGEDAGVRRFVRFLKDVGFDLVSQDTKGNKMFFTLTLRRATRVPVPNAEFQVKACIYKRR